MDITIRQGETLQIPITINDTSATTVRFVVADSTGSLIIDATENFIVEGEKAIATVSTNDTDVATGDYTYQLIVTYSDGIVDILPDPDDCQDGDCELPKLIICESLTSGLN